MQYVHSVAQQIPAKNNPPPKKTKIVPQQVQYFHSNVSFGLLMRFVEDNEKEEYCQPCILRPLRTCKFQQLHLKYLNCVSLSSLYSFFFTVNSLLTTCSDLEDLPT